MAAFKVLEVRDFCAKQGANTIASPPEQFAATRRAELELTEQTIETEGIKPKQTRNLGIIGTSRARFPRNRFSRNMPTYEYECASCGGFTAIRPMLEFRNPQPCPKCATPSPRVTLTVPALHGMFTSPSAASTGNSLQSCCGGNCSCR